MIDWNLAFLGGSATTPSTVCGAAQPVWLPTAALMAARSWLADSTRAGSVRLAGVVSSAQRRAERLQASWAFSSTGVSLSITSASISPRRAAASPTTPVVVAMSACTRATRTRSAGSGWLASVRWAWIFQAASAAARRMAGRRRPVAGSSAALSRRAAMEPAASCSMASNRAIMPPADSTSSAVGRSTKGWRRRAPTSRRCWRSR